MGRRQGTRARVLYGRTVLARLRAHQVADPTFAVQVALAAGMVAVAAGLAAWALAYLGGFVVVLAVGFVLCAAVAAVQRLLGV